MCRANKRSRTHPHTCAASWASPRAEPQFQLGEFHVLSGRSTPVPPLPSNRISSACTSHISSDCTSASSSSAASCADAASDASAARASTAAHSFGCDAAVNAMKRRRREESEAAGGAWKAARWARDDANEDIACACVVNDEKT